MSTNHDHDLRSQILRSCAAPLPHEPLRVEAWDADGEVWAMAAGERDRFELAHAKADQADFRARLVALCFRVEGRHLFTEADVPTLSRAPAWVLDPIVAAALRLNRFSDADVKELEKNSSSGPPDGS